VSALPRVGVIVPVHADPIGLDVVLRRLAIQDYPADQIVVVIAVDGGDEETIVTARSHGARVVSLVPGAGSYAARNRGIDELPDDVDVVVFTDADCVPPAGWLSAHVDALANADLSGGAIRVTMSSRPSPAEYVDRIRHLQQRSYVTKQSYAATANLAVRREVLRRVRFDGSLQTGGDVDFGHRAVAAGFRLAYTPTAEIEHPARRDVAALRRKIARICAGMAPRPAYWSGRLVPPARPRRGVASKAWREGVSRNPLWLIRAVLLDWSCQRRIVRSAVAAGAVVGPSRQLTVGYVVDRPAELTQTFVSGELEELRRQGARVVMIAVRPARNAAPPDVPILVLRGGRARWASGLVAATATALVMPHRMLRYRRALAAVRSELGGDGHVADALPYAAAWLRRQGVDVLHAHFAWSGAAAAMCLSELTGKPWSMTMHANDIFCEQRNLAAKLAAADRLITVCEYNREFLRSELGVSQPIDLVLCGTDVPVAAARGPRQFDIVAVGRLVEKKGFDLLIEAVAKLRPARGPMTVRIVGSGPLESELRQLADTLGVADIIEFAGARPHAETLQDVAAARLICLPARIAANGDRDSMPVVLKEAMAAGVPVVATDVAGIPEMVDDEVGRLVPPDDPHLLAAALESVLDLDANEWAEMGERGRVRAGEGLSMSNQVTKLRSILTELAKESA
jgi:colanic acid/amylovoran biosynthesis glycosyltransferase